MRPPLRRIGGKVRLAAEIVKQFTEHRVYVEPFCGVAAVLFAKEPSLIEVINDTDRTLVSFFHLLRDKDKFRDFEIAISLTPYSRAEYYNALETWRNEKDEIERLRKWYMLTIQAFGNVYGAGWAYSKTVSRSGMSQHVASWLSRIERLPEAVERLRRVQIECLDYKDCLLRYDGENTLFYCDPPYLHDTRQTKDFYKYEMSFDDHAELIQLLQSLKGKVYLSGYVNELYMQLEAKGWRRLDFNLDLGRLSLTERKLSMQGKSPKRIDSLWIKP